MSILSYEEEERLLAPIRARVGEIQSEIDRLRENGTTKVVRLQNQLRTLKSDRSLTRDEKAEIRVRDQKELQDARKVQSDNRAQIDNLVAQAESYLNEHYDTDYYKHIQDSTLEEKQQAKADYERALVDLKNEHERNLADIQKKGGPELQQELKDEKAVYKNRLYDAKSSLKSKFRSSKERRHAAFAERFHMIDLLRNSNFTFKQSMLQKVENYRYSFNWRHFLLNNGLYIVIILIFIGLAIVAPVLKGVDLLTLQNVLNILQQASPRMYLALGVAGLILLTGTDLSIGRMVGMGMVVATVIMHKGPNTGSIFGHTFDFTGIPIIGRIILALIACVIATTVFTMIAGFFTARFKMHPFVSTMANMLMIFGLVTYATKGVSFGAIEQEIPAIIVPSISGFPTIILWAVAATAVVWFIWNKTTFGKNLYAVGGNPEAAAVSGISVFRVTMGAFILAGILYGFGSWLESARMFGSGSAAYGQGWDMDAIAACVVGGVSFTGGIGKISGVVVGVMIFTGLTYSLTILGIDTNLQFVFEGMIILAAVTLDSLKYVQKK